MPQLSHTPTSPNFKRGVTFWGTVGAVMTALHIKDKFDEYRQVSSEEDDELGRVALSTPTGAPPRYRDGDEEAQEALLNTDIPSARQKRKRQPGWCVCCGLNCGLFCKALGITVLLFLIFGAVKLIIWAVSPQETGLDGMPVFGTSLGCSGKQAPYIYNYDTQRYHIPIGTEKADHMLDLRGDAVGTLTIAQGAEDATHVVFEMTLRSNNADILKDVNVHIPTADGPEGTTSDSRAVLSTPAFSHSITDACMRYDATIYVPPNLQRLHVKTHTLSHVQFAPDATGLELDTLFVTMYKMSRDNILAPHESVKAKRLGLEVYRGWIVGEVSILDKTTVTTQRGDGIVNVHAVPVHGSHAEHDGPASFSTVTGFGRTDVRYLSSSPHRAVNSEHLVQGRGDTYLHYEGASFNGHLDVRAKSYTAKGVQGLMNNDAYVGNKDGQDKLSVSSPSGWVGLYFQ